MKTKPLKIFENVWMKKTVKFGGKDLTQDEKLIGSEGRKKLEEKLKEKKKHKRRFSDSWNKKRK